MGARWLEVGKAFVQVGLDRMSLREVISMIRGTGGPMNGEVLLFYAVTNPEISHIDGFTAFNPHRLIGYALGGSIIGDDRGGSLGVPEIGKGGSGVVACGSRPIG